MWLISFSVNYLLITYLHCKILNRILLFITAIIAIRNSFAPVILDFRASVVLKKLSFNLQVLKYYKHSHVKQELCLFYFSKPW